MERKSDQTHRFAVIWSRFNKKFILITSNIWFIEEVKDLKTTSKKSKFYFRILKIVSVFLLFTINNHNHNFIFIRRQWFTIYKYLFIEISNCFLTVYNPLYCRYLIMCYHSSGCVLLPGIKKKIPL